MGRDVKMSGFWPRTGQASENRTKPGQLAMRETRAADAHVGGG
jgi:hypothetical protein